MNAALAVILCSGVLVAQGGPPGASVAGHVYDQRDAKPLSGVRVLLIGIAPSRRDIAPTSTDDRGAYAFENVEPGVYRVEVLVSAGGYLPPRAAPLAVVRAAGERKQIDLHLVQPGVLEGTVSRADGAPLPGVLVQAVAEPNVAWTGLAAAGRSVATDEKGLFRIVSLPPGRYTVRALPQSARTDDAGVPTDARAVVLPDPVLISPGAETRVSLELQPLPVHSISGRVFDSKTGQPLTRGSINATHYGALTRPGGFSEIAPDGSFRIQGLPSGSYRMNVFFPGFSSSGPYPVDFDLGDHDATDAVVNVRAGLALRGRIVALGGASPAHLSVHLQGRSVSSARPAVPVQDGRFEIPSVYPGDYEIAVWGDALAPAIKVARMGATDVLERGIQVTAQDSELPELEISIDARATSIAGRVLDEAGQPAPGAMVMLFDARVSRRHPDHEGQGTAITGLDGGYTIENVVVGEHLLLAARFGVMELREPGVFAKLEKEMLRVRVEKPEPLRRDLRLSATIEAVARSLVP